jgi:hypothetical protein
MARNLNRFTMRNEGRRVIHLFPNKRRRSNRVRPDWRGRQPDQRKAGLTDRLWALREALILDAAITSTIT